MMKSFRKRLTFFSYAFLLSIVFFYGCSPRKSRPASNLEQWMQNNGKVKVLSTTAIIDDIVRQVGGDRIDHISLICGEIDPHSYELVKGDDEKLSAAQVIFYNGLGLEHGASLRYQLEHHANAIPVGQSIQERFPDQIIYDDGQLDPHIWMDIELWSMIIDPILQSLKELDPAGAGIFEENADRLRQAMLHEHQEIKSDFQKVPADKRYLVTSHDAFNYFTRSYLRAPDETEQSQWSVRFEAPEGLAPDGQLSTTDIQRIIEHLCIYHIQVVFPESNVSKDSLKKIVHACRQKGLEVRISGEVLYGDAMGSPDSGADTYLKMIRQDADVMIAAWEQEGKT
ncbi:MAG: zinc ABC transporter substrate-binding protein [Verrucomicrobia bacterium]|nr:zinc ABC transporter substrate-binding protein [Verrucomicrobiota bacterium]